MGNIEQFPNATFYIQERELSKWVWAMSLERRFRWLMLGIDPADIMKAVDLARQGRLVCVDGDRENVLPGIDLHAAFDTHTWGSMYVHGPQRPAGAVVRTRGCSPATSSYAHENLRGTDPNGPAVHPGRPGDRQPVQPDHDRRGDGEEAGGDPHRVIPVHEERLKDLFPSRITKAGLRITELALADGERASREVIDLERSQAGKTARSSRARRRASGSPRRSSSRRPAAMSS